MEMPSLRPSPTALLNPCADPIFKILFHFGRRAEYHVAHLYNHYVTKGLDWKETPKAFQISVLNFLFDESEKDCISYYLMRNQNGRTIARMLNVIFMELPKIEPVPDEKTMINAAERRGRANGIQQVARNAIKEGLPTEQIAKLTGLTVDEINKLK